jgi:rhamnose utilization protein RhaD (predicted bifunctional aldolase and dehydrogenase)
VKSKWSDKEATAFITRYAQTWGKDLALRTYTSRLLASEKELVLHGGGNTSVKGKYTDVCGKTVSAVFVKASGYDLDAVGPEGYPGLDLERLRLLRELPDLADAAMANEIRTKLFDANAPAPSIETLLHAFIPAKYIDHTHADSILALTNQSRGKKVVEDALGRGVIILDYSKPGFALAKAAAAALADSHKSEGMVLMKHGLLTWGEDARESYEKTIELVTRAEKYLARKSGTSPRPRETSSVEEAKKKYAEMAPVLRGLLAVQTQDPDMPYEPFILQPLINEQVLDLLEADNAKEIVLTPPLTADHLIRTKPLPLFVDRPRDDSSAQLKEQIAGAIRKYEERYSAYLERYWKKIPSGLRRFDSKPRILLIPGLGAICAGKDVMDAAIVSDITAQTLAAKMKVAAFGRYEGLSEEHIFDMEYFSLQHAKLKHAKLLLQSKVALVTGAAGAIGSGICQELLKEGCHVAVTDLSGDHLDSSGVWGARHCREPRCYRSAVCRRWI